MSECPPHYIMLENVNGTSAVVGECRDCGPLPDRMFLVTEPHRGWGGIQGSVATVSRGRTALHAAQKRRAQAKRDDDSTVREQLARQADEHIWRQGW